MLEKLKIAFRKKQLYKELDIAQPVIVDCDDDGNPIYVPGLIPDNDFIDMTEFTDGLEKLNLTWDAIDTDSSGGATQSEGANNGTTDLGSNYNKGITLQLMFTGNAFWFIYNWMMQTPCQMLNSVEVRITDVDCNRDFRLFEIKVDNITYRPFDEPCILQTSLVEVDNVIQAFQTTIIEDDWQKWFNSDSAGVKDHPAFMFIVEKKPTFILIVMIVVIYLAGMLSAGILIALDAGKEWIRKTLGVCYFCPSPLIRTYIQNICAKFGFTYDTMFDDDVANPYRNACLFFPASLSEKNFTGFNATNNKFFWDNRVGIAFNQFLDQLKLLFNAEWYCTPNNELIFKPKSFFINQAPIYDFTANGSQKLINYETSFNGKKKPSYGNYNYRVDPQDLDSPDPKWRYNTIVDFTKGVFNGMLEGNLTKSFDFASTAFMYDGTNEDFIKSAVETARLIAVGALLIGLLDIFTAVNFLTVVIVIGILTVGYGITNSYVNDFFDNSDIEGAVRVSSDVINVPRVLLWDGESMTRAKVVSVTNPAINAYYNTDATDYYTMHKSNDGSPFGTGHKIYNYPMYVDEMFTNNLYDRFHELDNPLHNPVINQTFKADVQLCCSMSDTLGFWQNQFVKIGAVVIVENRNGRLIKARLTSIKPDYDKGIIHLEGGILR